MTEREGKIYCKACYGKAFGPKGIGFGGAMSSTEGSSPVRSPVASVSTLNTERERPVSPGKGSPAAMSPGSANGGCPTCGKQVYFAEQVCALLL